MPHGLEFVAILTFVSFSIPIVGALWNIFAAKAAIENRISNVTSMMGERITNNEHRLDLLEQRIEHLIDQYTLAQNGQRELVQHVRDRSKSQEEKLSARVTDLERFLEKSYDFSPRQFYPDSGLSPQ